MKKTKRRVKMNLKSKVKSYSFWISLISAILIVVRIVGEHFNWFINEGFIMDVVTAVCGVLVLLGILSAPANSDSGSLKEQSKEIQQQNNKLNSKIEEDIMAEKLTIQEQIEVLKNGLDKKIDTPLNAQKEQSQADENAVVEQDGDNQIENQTGQQIMQNSLVQINDTGIEMAPLQNDMDILLNCEQKQLNQSESLGNNGLDCDEAGCENVLILGVQEDDIKTSQDDSQITDETSTNEGGANIATQPQNKQNEQELSQNQEMVLDEVLSNLDKSQLKALLMDILMRL